MSLASEAGHWYEADGKPCYTVVGRNGERRPTTLRDTRKMNLYPSVTTIIRCAAAPGLERWKAEQLLMAGLTLPFDDLLESEADWIKRVWEDSKQQARQAAERGAEIHAAIEKHYRGKSLLEEEVPYAEAARQQISNRFGGQTWRSERSFAHPLGYGGKVDLHSNQVVVDFKTKEGPLDGLKLYDSHFMQLAAYANGLGLRTPRCAVVFVRRDQPEAELKLLSKDDVNRGWLQFNALLQYWQAKTRHVPK
jgi:hypothetical protein